MLLIRFAFIDLFTGLSTHQIAQKLDLNKDDAQQMTSQLHSGIVEKKPEVRLEGEVERKA